MNETTAVIVGIDVSKAMLDVAARPGGRLGQFPNDEAGIDALVARLKALVPRLIVLEATGRLEMASASALAAPGLPVPRPARARTSKRILPG